MELQLVSKEVAVLAKEIGFDWRCFNCLHVGIEKKEGIRIHNWNDLNTYISIPEQELLAKWLRDIHEIHLHLCYFSEEEIEEESRWNIDIYKYKTNNLINMPATLQAATYEEVLELGLKKSLEYLKEKLQKS